MTTKGRLRVPRQIRTGSRSGTSPGTSLRCAVVASTAEEWVGADLDSGALVRASLDGSSGPAVAGLAEKQPLEVVSVVLGPVEEAPDPSRPEAIEIATSESLGTLSRRQARRLLRTLAAPERDGAPILGTRGPSIAFEDLDGSAPSLVLLKVSTGSIELLTTPNGAVRCSIDWAGVRQGFPLADPRALAALAAGRPGRIRGGACATALGFHPGYALVGLGAVDNGHAPKVVLSILAR